MTSESTWHRVWMGAKLTLGAAVLAGVVAFSAPAHAVTFADVTLTGGLVLDPAVNSLGFGDKYGINIVCDLDGTSDTQCQGETFLANFKASTDLGALTISTFLLAGDFTNGVVEWLVGGVVVAGKSLTDSGQMILDLAAGGEATLRITFDSITSDSAFLSVRVSAVPIPAGLLLFLSGLAGIGFLGRYKAKRNGPAVA